MDTIGLVNILGPSLIVAGTANEKGTNKNGQLGHVEGPKAPLSLGLK